MAWTTKPDGSSGYQPDEVNAAPQHGWGPIKISGQFTPHPSSPGDFWHHIGSMNPGQASGGASGGGGMPPMGPDSGSGGMSGQGPGSGGGFLPQPPQGGGPLLGGPGMSSPQYQGPDMGSGGMTGMPFDPSQMGHSDVMPDMGSGVSGQIGMGGNSDLLKQLLQRQQGQDGGMGVSDGSMGAFGKVF